MRHRLQPIDWMRGIAMILMVTDHASEAFNAARPVTDSALFPGWNRELDPLQFPVRWLSHLCAPTFLFLAGTSLALSIERRRELGATAAVIDRDLLVRGLVILAVDLSFINLFWMPGTLLLQVMYAIGLSMIAMIALRRLPDALLLTAALLGLVAGEWLRTGSFLVLPSRPSDVLGALLVNAGLMPRGPLWPDPVLCAYPVLPWCAMLALGWLFGRYLLRGPAQTRIVRDLLLLGTGSLAVYAALRGANGFGNLGLLRTDGSLLQWLHVSKYPPSLTFTALELGLMLLLLAGLFRLELSRSGPPRPNGPVLVFGQTAFFFYVAHILLLEVGARLSGLHLRAGLGTAMIAGGIVLVVLYPLCLGYRRLKARYPRSPLRYL